MWIHLRDVCLFVDGISPCLSAISTSGYEGFGIGNTLVKQPLFNLLPLPEVL